MSNKRVLRVAEALRRELSFILDRKLGDRKVGMVTVTRVELSDDLRYAKVFVSFMGGVDGQDALKRLTRAGRFLRTELPHALNLRVVPRLTFLLDDSAENYIRIAEVLKTIHEEDVTESGDEAGEEDTGGETEEAG